MADKVSVLTGGSNAFQTTSEHLNNPATDFISDGVVGAVTNTSGVAPSTGALAVNAQGSPNMTVAVSAGIAYVTATPTGQASQRLRANIAAQNATIAANAMGGTRYDWIYVTINATNANTPNVAGDNVASITVSRSTSSVTDTGTPPAYGYNIAKVTVANGAVSITNGTIADSRTRTGPNWFGGGSIQTTSFSNPYKFSVYRTAAQNGGTGALALVQFDTKTYDTGTNVDVVTNKGRFTAPAAGFYRFDSWITFAAAAGDGYIIALYKNGTLAKQGGQGFYAGSTTAGAGVTGTLSLAANDYIEVYLRNGAGAITVGAANNYFEGNLVSAT